MWIQEARGASMSRPKGRFGSGKKRLMDYIRQEGAVLLSDGEISTTLDLSLRSVQRYLSDFAKTGSVEVSRKRYKTPDCNWHNARVILFKSNEG